MSGTARLLREAQAIASIDLEPYRLELMRRRHAQRSFRDENNILRGGLMDFIRDVGFPAVESVELVEGQVLYAMIEHLEACQRGEINRILINVFPGAMKSLLVNCFFPSWIWGPMRQPGERFLAFSYSLDLTLRDQGRFKQVIQSDLYQKLYGDVFQISNEQIAVIQNDRSGWKMASSVGGKTTGFRATYCLLDDPHNVSAVESEVERASVTHWFRESLSSRFSDLDTGRLIIIKQRLHEDDISGVVLSTDFNYEHLCIPWFYDPDRLEDANGNKFKTSIGWSDWRTEKDEPAWPERFSDSAIKRIMSEGGPYMWASQFQQSPQPRGGGLLKRAWWKLYEHKDNRWPPFEFKVASLDCAATIKEESAFSAMTVWGIWRDPLNPEHTKVPRLLLCDAWQKRCLLHGDQVQPRLPHEVPLISDTPQIKRRKDAAYARRVGDQWGLVEWVLHTCRKFDVDVLLIEHEKTGLVVASELRRLFKNETFGVQLLVPKGDKYARAASCVPMFANELIYAPDFDWADQVISQCESFPRGKFKDLVDSTSQALRWIRDQNLMLTRDEVIEAERQANSYENIRMRHKKVVLYPV